MKQFIFMLMMFSTVYAQSFYLSDCMLKTRKNVESIIKPKEVVPLSMGCEYDMYRYDDTILVTYENGMLTYIEVTSSIKYVGLQTKRVFDVFASRKDVIFTKVFVYDKWDNQYLVDVFNEGTKEYTIYIQLLSKTPDKPLK